MQVIIVQTNQTRISILAYELTAMVCALNDDLNRKESVLATGRSMPAKGLSRSSSGSDMSFSVRIADLDSSFLSSYLSDDSRDSTYCKRSQ